MPNIKPYLKSGHSKTCWSCGQPFIVRRGNAEAIVGDQGYLYCDRFECKETALAPHVHALQHATALARAA